MRIYFLRGLRDLGFAEYQCDALRKSESIWGKEVGTKERRTSPTPGVHFGSLDEVADTCAEERNRQDDALRRPRALRKRKNDFPFKGARMGERSGGPKGRNYNKNSHGRDLETQGSFSVDVDQPSFSGPSGSSKR